jgi:alcohol dehydrogenase
MIDTFSIARLPRIEFGAGALFKVTELLAQYGRHVLVVAGARSFTATGNWEHLQHEFSKYEIEWRLCRVEGEPSPASIDGAVRTYRDHPIDVVLGVGGGSALDAAKAIAGLLRVEHSVMDYLEGVGPELPYHGPAVPLIAVPTTAGTGSEATKNAVLSVQGPDGFKKSFRHEKLVAEYALVDPNLLASCPPELIAANGMDALTQLIESYVSIRSNTFTDALAISALRAARDGLLPWYEQGPRAVEAPEKMAYAALISGITLAQTGLGSVHGLASPLGAFYPIPHGVVCGTLVALATEVNIQALRDREPDNPALGKYARLGEVLCQHRFKTKQDAWEGLVNLWGEWTERLKLPRLAKFGLSASGLDQVVAHSRGSSMKTNPIVLSGDEVKGVVEGRL